MQALEVALGERSYPIHIGPGLLGDDELLRRGITASQVLIITNEVVAPLYLDALSRSLAAVRPHALVLPDGEGGKTLGTLARIIDELVENGFRRDACLVALGGGVIGDLTGFAAACYQRGIAFAQIPTTLLAQVDASVGGKTAVNHAKAKNMIGAFHQPCCVVADTDTLATLPQREFSAGLAEVVKHGLSLDAEFFGWLEARMDDILAHDADALAHIVRRSCEIKAAVVAQDERERGRRALLNLGHTFGHALESLSGYGRWLHGEAVAIGIALAARTSAELGMIDAAHCERIGALLARAGLPVTAPGVQPEALLARMNLDKKASERGLSLVLLERIGRGVVVPAPDEALLRHVVRAQSQSAA
ncbi:MAG: 3-dehydroquinate synthase [Rhodospirillaceae bacterium]|nr:3-dehydroquinate synthase [Rhodospirillaceae bacterium]